MMLGRYPVAEGEILLSGQKLNTLSIGQRREVGIAYIPQDRFAQGMLPEHSLLENYMLNQTAFPARQDFLIHRRRIVDQVQQCVAEYEIKANSPYQPMNSLSGGHQQRCMISRELLNKPRLILAHNPTRGLDIRASRFVHEALHSACARGTGMILFSSELSELFLLCHRIGVLCGGWLREIRNREHWDMEALGRVMAGAPQ